MDISRRISERIVSYWNSIRGERALASEDAVDWFALRDIIDSCYLVKVKSQPGGPHFECTFLGSSVKEAHDAIYADTKSQKTSANNLEYLHENFMKVLKKKAPLQEESELKVERSKKVKFRQGMVPLADDDNQVVAILGALRYKQYTE